MPHPVRSLVDCALEYIPTEPTELPPAATYVGCYDSRKRHELGWVSKDRHTQPSLEVARQICKGYKYFSYECPMKHGAELWCINNLGESHKLDSNECRGDPKDQSVTNGSNGHCTGYPDEGTFVYDGNALGGSFRSAVYKPYASD